MSSRRQVKSKDEIASNQRTPGSVVRRLGTPALYTHPLTDFQRARHAPNSLMPREVLELQSVIGNRAVQGLLTAGAAHPAPQRRGGVGSPKSHAVGGLQDLGSDEGNVLLGGRTIGEFVGDVARPVETAVGNVLGSAVGALTGVSISSNTNSGPTWSNHGEFSWHVGFNTSGRNGWIVQEIVNTYRAEDTAGQSVVPAHTPRYWEAWHVDGAGNVTQNIGPDNDFWERPSLGNNTQGHWSMSGSVYFTATDPATQGFSPGGVADAGILLSTTSAPSGLGIARLHRYAQGTWDSTGAAPTHTGSAGP